METWSDLDGYPGYLASVNAELVTLIGSVLDTTATAADPLHTGTFWYRVCGVPNGTQPSPRRTAMSTDTRTENAQWPYGYYPNADGTTPKEPSRFKIYAGAAAIVLGITITAMACNTQQDAADSTPTISEHEQRVNAFLKTPAVRNSGVSDDTAKQIAGQGCAGLQARNAAGDTTHIVAKVVSVTDQIHAQYRGVSPRSIAAIIGAGSVAYCPEMTDVLKAMR